MNAMDWESVEEATPDTSRGERLSVPQVSTPAHRWRG